MPIADAPPAPRDDGPFLGATFRVRISGTASARRRAGLPIARVGWGPFPVAPGDAPTVPVFAHGDEVPARHVLLSRGLSGSTDLADWWRTERSAKRSAARTVVVELIEPGSETPVLTWTFRGCRVVQLSHAPLDALAPTVVTESLLFGYTDVDIV